MRTTPRRCAALLAATGLVSGCSMLPGEPDDPVLEVWMMNQSAGGRFLEGVVAEFEDTHGVEVNLTVQEWSGVGEKVTDALVTGDGPDVIEVGNTQVAQYVETDGVADLTPQVVMLSGDDWIPGLADPGEVYGHQYGIPFYAANRIVIHRTDLFEEAGVEPPRDRDEWLEITRRLDSEPGQQGIYLPGQNWYVLAGFVWDEGGDLARDSGGVWRGTLDTPEAAAGMDFYAQLHALGDAPPDTDEGTPPHEEVFATREVAQLISTPGSVETIVERNPELEGKLGYFPIPGPEPDEPGTVFTGGSNLIIPRATEERELAFEFVKLLTSDSWQTELARTRGVVPNRTTLTDAVRDDPAAATMTEAAANGRSAPRSPHWGELESRNPIKEYQTEVLRGADPFQAGAAASEEITAVLSGRVDTADDEE